MLSRNRNLLLIIPLLIVSIIAFAQKSDNLKTKRNSVKKEIEKTASEIQKTSKEKKSTFQQYKNLKEKVGSKKAMITELNGEIEAVDIRIARQESIVTDLEADLELIKENYAELLRQSYRNNPSNEQFLFLISAVDFNDLARRWQFLKQYHNFKKRQIDLVRKTQIAFEKQNEKLVTLKAEKAEVIEHVKAETQQLGIAIQKKQKTVKALSKKERSLKVKKAKQEKAKKQLNNDIEKAIYAEIKQERTKNRTSRGLKSSKSTKSGKKKKSNRTISRGFLAKKGKLPMPVKGRIVGKFGIRIHKEANNTKTESPGVDIKTTPNSSVKVVYAGKVVRSFFKPEFQNIVLVQHGEYFTLYSNLKSVVVKKGTILKAGDVIGKVATKNSKTELHFQIWKNGTKLNPADWF